MQPIQNTHGSMPRPVALEEVGDSGVGGAHKSRCLDPPAATHSQTGKVHSKAGSQAWGR